MRVSPPNCALAVLLQPQKQASCLNTAHMIQKQQVQHLFFNAAPLGACAHSACEAVYFGAYGEMEEVVEDGVRLAQPVLHVPHLHTPPPSAACSHTAHPRKHEAITSVRRRQVASSAASTRPRSASAAALLAPRGRPCHARSRRGGVVCVGGAPSGGRGCSRARRRRCAPAAAPAPPHITHQPHRPAPNCHGPPQTVAG